MSIFTMRGSVEWFLYVWKRINNIEDNEFKLSKKIYCVCNHFLLKLNGSVTMFSTCKSFACSDINSLSQPPSQTHTNKYTLVPFFSNEICVPLIVNNGYHFCNNGKQPKRLLSSAKKLFVQKLIDWDDIFCSNGYFTLLTEIDQSILIRTKRLSSLLIREILI